MKRLIAVLAVSMTMLFGLAACNPDDSTGGSPAGGGTSPGGLESAAPPDLGSPAAS